MFESLKKKLKSFFSDEKPKKTKKEKKSKEKKAQRKKTDKIKKQEKVLDELKQKQSIETVQQDNLTEQVHEIIEEEKEEKTGFFSKFIGKLSTSKLTQEQFEEFFSNLEIILLENNVALEAVDSIRKSLQQEMLNKDIKKSDIEKTITSALKSAIESILQEPPNLIEAIKNHDGVYTIVFFGINGSGKTTSVAKVASYLNQHNISCVLAAGDTFRAASIEQLETHASRLHVPIIKHNYNSDPAAVAFDAIKYAQAHKIKVVLVDTAGRMYTRENLMKEMEKIIRVSKPNLKLFVGESITGNDATEQARTFNETIGIDGIILTKADVDEKGGTALSVSSVTNKPIYFLGLGQSYNDLKPFKKTLILDNLGL